MQEGDPSKWYQGPRKEETDKEEQELDTLLPANKADRLCSHGNHVQSCLCLLCAGATA